MATFSIDVAVNSKSVNELEQDLQTLEAQFKTLKIGDPGFNELGNQIKGIRSQLKDVELQFEGLDKEQRATALVDTFNGLTGAVGAVSSAFIAFGASSEAIEDAEKKLLGVIGVVNGLRDVSNATVAANKLLGPSFDALGTSIKAAFTGGTVAAQTFKAAIAALGIPLLIAGVVALVDAFSSVNEETEKLAISSEKGFEAFNKELEKGNTLLQARLGFIKAQFGEEEALNEQLKQIQADRAKRRQAEVDLFDALNRAEKKSDRDKIDAQIKDNLEKSVALESQEATLQKQLQKIKDDATKEEQRKAEEAAKKADDLRKAKIKNEKDALLAEAESKRQLAIQLEDDEKARRKLILEDEIADLTVARDTALAQENLTGEAKRAIRAKFNNDVLAAQDKFNNDIADIDKKAEEKAKADAAKAAEELKAFQERAFSGELEAINNFYTAKENEITSQREQGLISLQEYNAKLDQIELDRLNNLLQATKDAGESTVEIEKQILAKKLALKEKDVETTKATTEAKKAAELEFAQAVQGAVSALGGLFKEGSDAAKAAALADIAIGTGVGFVRALAIAQEGAQATGPAAPFAFPIFYASQIAAVLSAASRAKTILNSGGSGTSSGPTVPSTPSLPNAGISQSRFGGFGTNTTPSIPTTGGSGGSQTGGPRGGVFKTYVLAGDVTSAQAAEAKINQRRQF